MEQATAIDLSIFQHKLKGFVFKKVRDKALTEDIVHDVFIKVQSSIHQLMDERKISGWIYQIARNTIIDHFRKTAKSFEPTDLNWENDTPNFNECVSGYLAKLIPALPEKYRVALELTEYKNMSQGELAKHLGISYSGAKSRVQRARLLLKEKINQELILKTDAYGNIITCRKTGCC